MEEEKDRILNITRNNSPPKTKRVAVLISAFLKKNRTFNGKKSGHTISQNSWCNYLGDRSALCKLALPYSRHAICSEDEAYRDELGSVHPPHPFGIHPVLCVVKY